jgi:DNA ligase (NAD+)
LQAESLQNLERMGERSAKKLLDGIEKSKSRELPKFLNALCIRHVGVRTATLLAKHFGSLDRLRSASEVEISEIDEVGPIIAKSVYNFFQEEDEMIGEFSACVLAASARLRAEAAKSQALQDMTIVVTGTLQRFKRTEIEAVIERFGGKPSSSVSSKTTFVLVGAEPGSKLDKAKRLGVKIVDEQEFLDIIGME